MLLGFPKIYFFGGKTSLFFTIFLNQKYFLHDFTLSTKTGVTKIHRDKTDGKRIDDFKITFVDTGLETLPGERILRVKEYIGDDADFMVTYGDGVSTIDIKELIAFHHKQHTIGTITGVFPRSKFGIVRSNQKQLATEFIEKAPMKSWVNGGFMIFKKSFFSYLRPGETEHPGLKRLVKERQLSLYPHKGFWHCMDTYQDVAHLNELWNTNPEWNVWN